MNYNEIINIFLIIGFIFVIGCSKLNLFSGTDYSAFSQLPSWDQNEGAIPNDSFFYVRLARENYEGHNFLQHAMYELDGGPGTDCKIPIDQKSSEDIFCQLEKLEGDLWAHPTVIEYNVPPGMCDYVAFDIPWHFNQNAGAGSKEVYKCDQNIGAAPDENGNIETEERYCLELGEEEILRGKKKVKEAVYTDCGMCSEKIEDICKYNRSNENENLSDCCIGTYTVTGRNEDVGEEGSFGDDLTKCIGGLGRMNWDYKNDLGIPQTIIYSADSDGYIGTYEIPSLDESIEKGETATFVVANYYDGIEEFNLDKLPTIYKTTALDSNHTAYRDLEGGEDGYPYFTWSCLDSAHEVKHRIHLIIREWNTEEEFTKFVDSNGSRGDPNIGGSEGTDCDYYSLDDRIPDTPKERKRFFSNCNDMTDQIKTGHPEIKYNN